MVAEDGSYYETTGRVFWSVGEDVSVRDVQSAEVLLNPGLSFLAGSGSEASDYDVDEQEHDYDVGDGDDDEDVARPPDTSVSAVDQTEAQTVSRTPSRNSD